MKTKKTAHKTKVPKGNEYPEWVSSPIRLTNDELKAPLPVIELFFKQYSLIELRALLSDWLFLLCSNQVHSSATFMIFSEQLERFAEAVFQLTMDASAPLSMTCTQLVEASRFD